MQLLNSRDGSLRRTLPPHHEDVTTLSQCCSAAEALIGVLSDVLDVSKMDSQGVKVGKGALSGTSEFPPHFSNLSCCSYA